MDAKLLDLLEQIAKAIAAQFGSNCEVVIHELSGKSAYSSIVAIENGHVTGRKVGDGPSHVVLEQLGHEDDGAKDQLAYLTRTKDGKILKSSSVYIRDEAGKVAGILGINYDISMMQMFENSLHDFISVALSYSLIKSGISISVVLPKSSEFIYGIFSFGIYTFSHLSLIPSSDTTAFTTFFSSSFVKFMLIVSDFPSTVTVTSYLPRCPRISALPSDPVFTVSFVRHSPITSSFQALSPGSSVSLYPYKNSSLVLVL